MTAESIEYPRNPDTALLQGLGNLVMPRESSETQPTPRAALLNEVSAEFMEDAEAARIVGLVSTLIKEKFQTLTGNLNAEERDTKRAQLREASVRLSFEAIGLLPDTQEAADTFTDLYRSTEAQTANVDRSRLADLAELHEHHPAIRVFDTLSHTSSIKSDDVVFMRRTSLLLIDEHTS